MKELIPIDKALVKEILMPRPKECHKGTCGRVLVIAGSTGLTGAAVMASQAAMRAGAGIVSLACAKSLNDIFEIKLTEVMTIPVEEADTGCIGMGALDTLLDKAEEYDVALIGPGLGRHESTIKLVREFVRQTETQLVIDADALYAFRGQGLRLKECKKAPILTPHVGELAGLLNLSVNQLQANYLDIIRRAAMGYHAIFVAKSEETIVVYPDGRAYATTVGNPGMATAGSGDVLAGTIAGLYVQTRKGGAPLAGVYVHGRAGDLSYADNGNGLIATDMIGKIGPVLLELAES
ncbi:YjeF protein [Anaerovibrio sp. JC8]|uniref:NAD(P)H-hydrate dehydratase n=1 Tax=Anaerovibrio sp. JC8 TaxID=1240085 RepID=UPI000A0CDCC7|nr:NAD(P)H-hydrate dehydratase [Anaerovibrio sp. JC8]ORT99559.1 YjeF protein [Anaerovibrio sp. JC8]